MKKVVQLLLVLLLAVTTAAAVYSDCYTVVVGKNASVDGSVLFGHNEQNGGQRFFNFRVVPRMSHEPGEMVELRNGGKVPEIAETPRMLWSENPGISFSDTYMNEYGVVAGTDGCGTREDSLEEVTARGGIVDGGIEYMLRRLVVQRAKTSREGVQVAGELLNHFGYTASGRTMVIADSNEAWLLSMVRGMHWVARRVPDDMVVLLPNVHVIDEVNLEDTANFIGSPDIIEYAIQRGWYDPASGQPFSFREAYNPPPDPGSFMEKYGCDPRQWRGQCLVTGQTIELPVKKPLPFAVKSNRKLGVQDVIAILRDHLVDTPFDATEAYAKGSPHDIQPLEKGRAICGPSTQEGAVMQLRSWLPPDIGCIYWKTSAAPCASPLTPWYIGLTETPESYYKPWDIREQLKVTHHFNPPAGSFDYDPEDAWWVFNALENLVDFQSFKNNAQKVRPVWDALEKELSANQAAFEAEVLKVYAENPELGRKMLTEYSHTQALQAVEKARQLSSELITVLFQS
jgi:dipeptidase